MSRPLPIADNLEYGTCFFFLFPIRTPRNPTGDNLNGISKWRGGHLRSFQLSERPTLFLLCTEHILGYFIEIEDVLSFPNHSLRSSTGRISHQTSFWRQGQVGKHYYHGDSRGTTNCATKIFSFFRKCRSYNDSEDIPRLPCPAQACICCNHG